MSDKPETYHNLQEYLESCFSDTDHVTKAMLEQAKQIWRKSYLSRYHKQYRERFEQISFRISKKQYKTLQAYAKTDNITVTTYIKRLVLAHIGNERKTTGLNVLPLLEAIDSLEEAIQEDTAVNKEHLLSLLERCQ